MADLHDRDTLRETLAAFDPIQTKITGGVLAVMFRTPDKVRDREWIAEQFSEVALLATDFDEVEAAQEFIRAQISPILNACYALFQNVGEDLAARADEDLGLADAMNQALSYFLVPESE
ncbi:MAG: hypothetical protein ACI8QC_004478 [Planctomycetota bacterium]|jgi:hypothetical protein